MIEATIYLFYCTELSTAVVNWSEIKTICENSDYHDGEYEDECLLGCCAM
jgi:hypothetical protein